VEVVETGSTIVVRMSRDEMTLLNNALNEILNGLDIEEFATRVGASREEAERLRAQIHSVL
jgi:hypothetical protein